MTPMNEFTIEYLNNAIHSLSKDGTITLEEKSRLEKNYKTAL